MIDDWNWILPSLLAGALLVFGITAVFSGESFGYGAILSGAAGLYAAVEIFRGRL